jgi:hypothetical protein
MAATSTHPGDVAIWIEKVIDSCETFDHEKVAQKLIDNFEIQNNFLESYQIKKLRFKLDQKATDRLDARIKAIKHLQLLTKFKPTYI